MTIPTRPAPDARDGPRPPTPAAVASSTGRHFAMWMWRCAVVLPHPALLSKAPAPAPASAKDRGHGAV